MMGRNIIDIERLVSQECPLSIEIDHGLFEYLHQKTPPALEDGESCSVEQFAAYALECELRDESYQRLRAEIVDTKKTCVWLRENLSFMVKLLLTNVADVPDTKADLWLKVLEYQGERQPSVPIATVIGEPPARHPRQNGNVANRNTDTQIHQLTIPLNGLSAEDLDLEAAHINMPSEELAVHILHNFRDNEHLREMYADLRKAKQMYYHVSEDFCLLTEEALVYTNPSVEKTIRDRLHRLRN